MKHLTRYYHSDNNTFYTIYNSRLYAWDYKNRNLFDQGEVKKYYIDAQLESGFWTKLTKKQFFSLLKKSIK